MPYVSIKTSAAADAATLDTLQKEVGRIIALIPGKTIDNCMTEITPGCHLFMGGAPAKAVFCEVRMYGAAPTDAKAAVTTELNGLFTRVLGAEKVYTCFMEFDQWGVDATLK